MIGPRPQQAAAQHGGGANEAAFLNLVESRFLHFQVCGAARQGDVDRFVRMGSTVTESAVADAMVPRTRSGVPVAASAADGERAEAAIARPRILFELMSSPLEVVV